MTLSSKTVLDMFFQATNTCPQQVAIELDEQMWTYGELLVNVTRVAYHLEIEMGQIIYQYVDRSLEMVCGLFAILCSGGVYVPLNPADPPMRIRTLLNEIQGRLVLIHGSTRDKFTSMNNEQMQIVDIEQILMAGAMEDVGEKEIYVSCQSASLIICTSGTTGHQKAVLHTHASLVGGLQALINWDTNRSNKFLQIGASSWIIHVLEIFFPLVTIPVGTLVLLRPGDHLNMARFCMVIKDKQITNLMIGSTLLKTLLDYLELDKNRFEQMLTGLRIICLTGESLKPQHLVKLKSMAPQTRIFMSYGQTEVLGAIGCYLEYNVSELGNLNVLPIGYPPLGCQCILVDESNERIIPSSYPDELGQIHIRGAGLFQCYYNNIELTNRTRVTINDEQFFKTGDLAHYNSRGELVHDGRVDFQIKIHGQRVEAVEIEGTIIAWSPSEISNCLVVKYTQEEDFLVAYIISNNSKLDTDAIRDYCKERLRQYMIPSHLIVLNKFPLNANGKIDRKQLPPPPRNIPAEFVKADEGPLSEFENQVHRLWCSMFQLDFVPRHANCFLLGGSSITMMRLVNYYQVHLVPDKKLDEHDFFENPTIADHVRHLTNSCTKTFTI